MHCQTQNIQSECSHDGAGTAEPPIVGPIRLKEPQMILSELIIYTLVGCSCSSVSVVKVNKISSVHEYF